MGRFVVFRNVQEGLLATRPDPSGHPSRERRTEPDPSGVGMRRDRRDLRGAMDPHPFAGHRDEAAVRAADPPVLAQLVGSHVERPGLRQVDQGEHVDDVTCLEQLGVERWRGVVPVWSVVKHHLLGRHPELLAELTLGCRHLGSEKHCEPARADQLLQRPTALGVEFCDTTEDRDLGFVAPSCLSAEREASVPRVEGMPHRVVERFHGERSWHARLRFASWKPLTLRHSSESSAADPAAGELAKQAIEEHGYLVLDDVLSADECTSLVAEVERVEAAFGIAEGTNDFEGFQTRRIFNLIGKSEPFRLLAVHDRVLPVLEAVLDPGLLLSGTTSMNIGPGETAQFLHADDGMVTLPRPHPPTMVTTLWALSPFRAENGGTRFVPGSHRFERSGPKPEDHVPGVVTAEFPAGSVLVLHASLWHGGGPNTTTDERRYGLSIQYVAGWCRQQQNLMLGLEPALVASFPLRLQELVGYSLYRNVMGHVDRQHPSVLLGVHRPADMVWDRIPSPKAE